MALKTWNINELTQADTYQTLVSEASAEAAIIAMVITNYGTSDTEVTVAVQDYSSNLKGYICYSLLVIPNESMYIDSKIFLANLANPDKIVVKATTTSVSVLAFGDST